eukprot:s710_g11.t1
MGPLPTVDEEVPADEDANVGDQVTAGNDAHEGNDVSEVNDAPAETEVVANDEGGTVAGSLEEEEQPLPPRVNREEGEHGMGPPPPPTRWDQRPSMVQQPQMGYKGAPFGFQQYGGGKGGGMAQQFQVQYGPQGLQGQEARIRIAQMQQWEAICKLNAAMEMVPPRPVPAHLLRPPRPGVGIPGVDYSLELRPLQQGGLHGGGAGSVGAQQGTISKAAGAGGSTPMPMPRATGAEAAASVGHSPVQEARPMASAPQQQMMGVPMTMTTATTQAPEARSCGTTLAHMIRMTTELRTGGMTSRPVSQMDHGLRTVARPKGPVVARSDDPEVVPDEGDELEEISSQETVTEVVSSTSKSS